MIGAAFTLSLPPLRPVPALVQRRRFSLLLAAGVSANPYAQGMAEMAAAALRERFRSGVTRPYAWRIQQIRGIIRMLTECENELIEAVCKDTGKPVEEMRISEVTQTLCAAQLIEKQLASWMPDQYFSQWGILFPSTPTLRHEPYGVVLMIAPFNFPLMLVLKPLLGAVAAGALAGLASSCVCANKIVRRL